MYIKDYNFRYGDLDSKYNIKHSAVLDILQDISICHSDEMDYTREKLTSMSIAWLLSGWKIRLLVPIDNKTPVTAKTAIMYANKFQVMRKYEIWQNGALKIIASAEWFTVDTDKYRLTRIPDEIKAYHESITEEHNGLEMTKLRGNKKATEIEQIKISLRDIDTNNHLNNVKSAEILLGCIPENMIVTEFQVTYKKQLYKGDVATICTQTTEVGFCAELRNDKGDPCVLLSVK